MLPDRLTKSLGVGNPLIGVEIQLAAGAIQRHLRLARVQVVA
jgi:hypothetical protein